jgi:hypothetical protein
MSRALLAQGRQGGFGDIDNAKQVGLDLRAKVVVRVSSMGELFA